MTHSILDGVRGSRSAVGRTVLLGVLAGVAVNLGSPGTGMARVYEVGPGHALAEIEEVPWESLEPGDTVLIHAREEPYRSKWVICRRGTAERPIVVRGVAGPDGRLPVVDGRDAVTRPELNYWNEPRGIIKIGGANRPEDTTPAFIVVENLEIRSARPPYRFTGRDGVTAYAKNAAAIFVEKGDDLTIRGCVLHDCGNGLFTASASQRVTIEHCWIYDNGIEDSIYEHNNYTNSQGIVFQFNHFGPLRDGCPGNNLKDRSTDLVVRYNWIEGGNRALDLVEGAHGREPRGAESPTFVYGNVLVKLDERGNNQVVHYGGDSGREDRYRRGVLHFYHNTVVSYRPGNTTLLRLSTNEQRVECRNNLVFVTAPGHHLALLAGAGRAELDTNWFNAGWRPSHTALAGDIRGEQTTLAGTRPGLADVEGGDFRLVPGSPAIGAAAALPPAIPEDYRPRFLYVPHRQRADRTVQPASNLGALEQVPP